jgi:plastocyanin
MHPRISIVASLGLAGAVVAGCSGGSSPANPSGPHAWSVSAGSSSPNQALQALLFYPSSITIDAGDTVVWTSPTAEVHSVSLPVPGTTPPPASDPSAPNPVGGTIYDGTTYISSGFFAGGATYSVRFVKPGTYTYYSIPQGFVSGVVIVQAERAPYPESQRAYNRTATAQSNADIAAAEASIATIPYTPGSNKIAAGVSPGGSTPANAAVMRFLNGPSESDNLSVTVASGTTLTFTNLSNNVPHTVTFPAVGASPPPGPPNQPASGGPTYDGTALVNSGVIPPGGTFNLTFTKAGTFQYYCLFHDDDEGMMGTVTVTP